MGKNRPAQRARRSAAKKRRKLLNLKYPNRTPAGEKETGRPQGGRRHESADPILLGHDSPGSDDGEAGSPDVQALLEPYSKEQLVSLLCDAALADPALHSRVRAAADCDISHRKVFVHGLSWDIKEADLLRAFSGFGAVDACNVVTDKATGRGKGFGFVMFRSRSGAVKALKKPHKQIGSRVAHCQLASLGPVAAGAGAGHHADTAGRKIYVSNVHADVNPEKLRAFFAKFGEIEMGPTGFDLVTGKSKGYAIFVYKTQEAARKALAEPHKMFEGHQLHCQWAAEPAKVKELLPVTAAGFVPTAAGLAGAAPQPVLAAVAAAQSLSLYSQNPAYAALLGQNPLLAAAAGINSAALNSSALNPAVEGGLAGYGGSSSLLGTYGTLGTAGLQGTSGLHGMQYGQSSSLGRRGGLYEGMPSFL